MDPSRFDSPSPRPAANPFTEIHEIARAPVLLVALDYDGTLAPIVSDPALATPNPGSLESLKSLAALENTFAAVVSGRSLLDLAAIMGATHDIHLVGSHGSEFDLGFTERLPVEVSSLTDDVFVALESIAQRFEGVLLERKPASVAVHYRNVAKGQVDDLLDAVLAEPATLPGVHLHRGKMVLELSAVRTEKGTALEMIRKQVCASAALYVGDDATDEDAFSTLRGPDVGIKVGSGESAARYRLRDPDEVARFLADLLTLRSRWLNGFQTVPIREYSLLSDQRTAALVSPTGRISWLCCPRLNSPTVFAELLGDPSTGTFFVAADGSETSGETDPPPIAQTYDADSLEVHTVWPTFEVIDYLDVSGAKPYQKRGDGELVRVIEGRGPVIIEFSPRIDFGRTSTHLLARDGGLEVQGFGETMVLRSPGITWSIDRKGPHHSARARLHLRGDPVVLELRWGTCSLAAAPVAEPERRHQNQRYWGDWIRRIRLPSVAPDLVKRSALTVRALANAGGGGIASCVSTSLPEVLAGRRNWDQRYCWLADAAQAAEALAELGSFEEGIRLLDWVRRVIGPAPWPERLRPVYTLDGDELGTEAEITELCGYAGSRPVRVGHAASRQWQPHACGALINLVDRLIQDGVPLGREHWELVNQLVNIVDLHWQEPDHGLWNDRRARHFVHSKVMCWLAVDRANSVAKHYVGKRPWTRLADEVAASVLKRGWNQPIGSFVAAYDEARLDAAVLYTGLSGLIPADDPRFVSTVAAIEHDRRTGNAVGNQQDDHRRTAWLIQSYLKIGRRKDAAQLFDTWISRAGPTGLFSQRFDPATGTALGNTPSLTAHSALIHTAVALAAHKSDHLSCCKGSRDESASNT